MDGESDKYGATKSYLGTKIWSIPIYRQWKMLKLNIQPHKYGEFPDLTTKIYLISVFYISLQSLGGNTAYNIK